MTKRLELGRGPSGDKPGWKSTQFKPGNKVLKKENLSEDSHNRRMKGLYKAWARCGRIAMGDKSKTFDQKIKENQRKRIRLKESVAKEAIEIQTTARKRAMAAMNRLQAIIESPGSKDSDAITAATVVLDRAYGRSPQTNINASIDGDGKEKHITSTELRSRIEKAIERINSLTDGAAEKGKSEERPADIRLSDPDTGGHSGSVH